MNSMSALSYFGSKYKPVKQFLRRFNEERRKAIGEEVARLLAAGFIVEVFHPENEICAAPIGMSAHRAALLVLFYHCRNVL